MLGIHCHRLNELSRGVFYIFGRLFGDGKKGVGEGDLSDFTGVDVMV